MKSLHFCTPDILKKIKNPKIKKFKTYRTGWLIQSKIGEIFQINERNDDKNDTRLLCAIVKDYAFLEYKNVPITGIKEVNRYNRNFKQWHIFQEITFKKIFNMIEIDQP